MTTFSQSNLINTSLAESLLGTSATQFLQLDDKLPDVHNLYQKNDHRDGTIYTIILSAIIFVTVISIFEIFRELIGNHYAKMALNDPKANNTEEDIQKITIANHDKLKANIVFSIFCIIISSISIYIYLKYMRKILV